MLLRYRREILQSWFLLVLARLFILVANSYNPLFYSELGKRLNFAIIIMGVIVGAMYIPRKELALWTKIFTGKVPRLSRKEAFGVLMNLAFGLCILVYLFTLILGEMGLPTIGSTEMLISCGIFAIIAAFHPHKISYQMFFRYSIILALFLGYYVMMLFWELGNIKYILGLLTFIAVVTFGKVMKND